MIRIITIGGEPVVEFMEPSGRRSTVVYLLSKPHDRILDSFDLREHHIPDDSVGGDLILHPRRGGRRRQLGNIAVHNWIVLQLLNFGLKVHAKEHRALGSEGQAGC